MASLLDKIKQSLNDNQGWFRQGKFTPVTQITGKSLVDNLNPPMLSPLAPNQNQNVNWNTPQTQQPTVIAPPKPSFKTEAATKLNSRLDSIKRWGVNAVKEQIPFTPENEKKFSPTDPMYGFKKGIVTKTVPELFNNTVVPAVRWAKTSGEVLAGKKDQQLKQIQNDAKTQSTIVENRIKLSQKLNYEGRKDEAMKILQDTQKMVDTNDFSGKFDAFSTQSDNERNQYVSDAVKTAEMASASGLGAPANIRNILTGSAISSAVAKVNGEDPFLAAGKGGADAFRFGGITRYTPGVDKIPGLNKIITPNANAFVKQIGNRAFGGGTNIIEDNIINLLDTGRLQDTPQNEQSFLIGAALSQQANQDLVPYLKKFSNKYITGQDFENLKTQIRDSAGRYAKDLSGQPRITNVNNPPTTEDMTWLDKFNLEGKSSELRGGTPHTKEEIVRAIQITNKLNYANVLAPGQSTRDLTYAEHLANQKPDVVPEGITNFTPAGSKPEKSKPLSIEEIMANRKTDIGTPKEITVKGLPIDVAKLETEGWQPTQINYAVKLANEARVNPKDVGAYVRGILKSQYPNQASKMGRPLPPEPSAEELARIDRNAGITPETPIKKPISEILTPPKPLEQTIQPKPEVVSPEQRAVRDANAIEMDKFKNGDFGKKPQVEPQVKPQDTVQDKVQVDTNTKTQSEVDKQLSLKEAEYRDFESKFGSTIDNLKTKEGIALDPITESKILSGEVPASAELKDLLVQKNQISTQNLLEVNPTFPKEKLKENYVPQAKADKLSVENPANGFGGMLADTTFDPAMKRTGTLDVADMATGTQGSLEAKKAYLNKKYYSSVQADKIMTENNIPRDKADDVLKFVNDQKANADRIYNDHVKNTDFGDLGKGSDKVDYIKETQNYQDSLAQITGKPIQRQKIIQRSKGLPNIADILVDNMRIDDTLMQQRTTPEIFRAFQKVRDSYLPNTQIQHKVALDKFITTVSNYEFEDQNVKDLVNRFIDGELKTGMVKQSTVSKVARLFTGLFSGAHIGGNVKTVITQPTELYRIGLEEGANNLKKGFGTAFSDAPRLRTTYGLDDVDAQMVAGNPEWKEVNDSLLDKAGKVNEKVLNVTMKGMQFTEELKNIILAASAEHKGLENGLKIDTPQMTHFVRDELFRVGHIGAKYSTPQIAKGGGFKAAALQYSQYALKNFVLKYDTLRATDKPLFNRLSKVTAQLGADAMATATVAIMTGIPAKTIYDYFQNSQLPAGFGPIITVPIEYLTEAKKYFDDSNNPDIAPEDVKPISDAWGDTTKRNFMPLGNQISKTTNAKKVLDTGYGESAKGNINYPVGDLNPVQKAQTLTFGTGAIPNKQKSDLAWSTVSKTGIYPTLTANQSAVLKSLPKDQQEAYYNKQLGNQVSNKKTMNEILQPKKQNLISSIFGGKKVQATDTFAIPDSIATQQDKTKFNGLVKTFIDAGNSANVPDEALKSYFYGSVEKLPESTASEVQNKQIEKFRKLDSIYASETLDQDTKDRLIKLSGIPDDEVKYYDLAKDNATVKAMRQEEVAGTMKREDWLNQLEQNRRLVGDKQIVDNATLNELYERGLLNDSERDYLTAIKFDPATKSYYLDRDFKNKQANAGASALKKKQTAFKTLQNKLDTINNKDSTSGIKKSIASYLGTKEAKNGNPPSETIGNVLSKGKFTQKSITPILNGVAKVNRVKSKYKFTK